MKLRDKILETSYELFGEKGYENTTVAEIIEKVGCSKGGFYHHFKSKEDIIEAITMNYIRVLQKSYEKTLANTGKSVLDLINEIVITINQIKENQIKEWPKIKNLYTFSGNHIILKKMAEQFEVVTSQYYTKLIEKGIKDGLFFVKYPQFLAEVWTREILKIYSMATKVIYSTDDGDLDEFKNLLEFCEELFNNSLNLEKDIIKIKDTTLNYVYKGKAEVNKLKQG